MVSCQSFGKYIHTLLKAWRESLQLFLPPAGSLFLLVTLNSFKQLFMPLLYGFWLLLLAPLGRFPIDVVVVFMTIVAARPSVCRKGWGYFARMALYAPVLFLSWFRLILGVWWSLHFLALFVFLVAALIDAGWRVRPLLHAPGRALGMYLRVYPVSFVLALLSYAMQALLLYYLPTWLDSRIVAVFGYVFSYGIAMPFIVTLLVNVYLKQTHEEVTRFYEATA